LPSNAGSCFAERTENLLTVSKLLLVTQAATFFYSYGLRVRPNALDVKALIIPVLQTPLMQIPGLGQLPHARSVTMQVTQGFCKNNSFHYKTNKNKATIRMDMAGSIV